MSRPSSCYLLLLILFVSAKRVRRQNVNYCFPRLQPPRNGYFNVQCPNYLGSSCTVSCVPGTTLIGESRLTCLPDTKTWNAPPPLCLPNPAAGSSSLTTLPQVTGIQGIPVDNGLYPGQQGIVIGPSVGINPGNIVPGGQVVPSPQVLCPALSPPVNGIRSGPCERATLGTTCLFSCMAGFVLSGYPILTCSSTGQWSPQTPPMCLGQQAVYPPVYPGNIPTGGSGNFPTSGPGDMMPIMTTTRPSTAMTTMTPEVVITVTTSRPTCPRLNPPLNGLAQGSCANAVPGSQPCFFSCLRGFILSGYPVLTCNAGGQWSAPAPICRGIVPYRVCGFRRIYGCRCRTCSG